MSLEASAFCLTTVEINMMRTVALHGPVSCEILGDLIALEALEQKGFVEKIHQDAANIDRYRLTVSGEIKYRQLNLTHFSE